MAEILLQNLHAFNVPELFQLSALSKDFYCRCAEELARRANSIDPHFKFNIKRAIEDTKKLITTKILRCPDYNSTLSPEEEALIPLSEVIFRVALRGDVAALDHLLKKGRLRELVDLVALGALMGNHSDIIRTVADEVSPELKNINEKHVQELVMGTMEFLSLGGLYIVCATPYIPCPLDDVTLKWIGSQTTLYPLIRYLAWVGGSVNSHLLDLVFLGALRSRNNELIKYMMGDPIYYHMNTSTLIKCVADTGNMLPLTLRQCHLNRCSLPVLHVKNNQGSFDVLQYFIDNGLRILGNLAGLQLKLASLYSMPSKLRVKLEEVLADEDLLAAVTLNASKKIRVPRGIRNHQYFYGRLLSIAHPEMKWGSAKYLIDEFKITNPYHLSRFLCTRNDPKCDVSIPTILQYLEGLGIIDQRFIEIFANEWIFEFTTLQGFPYVKRVDLNMYIGDIINSIINGEQHFLDEDKLNEFLDNIDNPSPYLMKQLNSVREFER